MRRAASRSGCEMNGEWLETISTTLSTPTDAIMARCCAGEMALSCVSGADEVSLSLLRNGVLSAKQPEFGPEWGLDD